MPDWKPGYQRGKPVRVQLICQSDSFCMIENRSIFKKQLNSLEKIFPRNTIFETPLFQPANSEAFAAEILPLQIECIYPVSRI